jgi:hypothetical protein
MLARLITRFALEGADEIYQSLFPLLMVDGIEEMVTSLNASVVLEILFKQLCADVAIVRRRCRRDWNR